MNKKNEAIMKILLGEPVKDVATKYNYKTSTLKRWVDNYTPPSKELMLNLLKENVVSLLTGGIDSGSQLTGIVNALKIIDENDIGENIMDVLLELGDDNDTTSK